MSQRVSNHAFAKPILNLCLNWCLWCHQFFIDLAQISMLVSTYQEGDHRYEKNKILLASLLFLSILESSFAAGQTKQTNQKLLRNTQRSPIRL